MKTRKRTEHVKTGLKFGIFKFEDIDRDLKRLLIISQKPLNYCAKDIGIPAMTLVNFLRGTVDPSFTTLSKIQLYIEANAHLLNKKQ